MGTKSDPPMSPIEILPLAGLSMIGPRSDLAAEIAAAMRRAAISFRDGDILVVAQKIVSKAEDRRKTLRDFTPSDRALALAAHVQKDPRQVEAVLSESRSVVRAAPRVLITEHRLGHIMANAGIDQSNVEDPEGTDEAILLLPADPDASARALRAALADGQATHIGVIVSDSFGRPWRLGTTGMAIGIAGPPAVVDRRGETDLFGRVLQATEIGFADAVASAAVLAMGEGSEGCPAAIVRGLQWIESGQTACDGLRKPQEDLFR